MLELLRGVRRLHRHDGALRGAGRRAAPRTLLGTTVVTYQGRALDLDAAVAPRHDGRAHRRARRRRRSTSTRAVDELRRGRGRLAVPRRAGLGAREAPPRDLREDDRARAVGPGLRHRLPGGGVARWPGAHRDDPELRRALRAGRARPRARATRFSELNDPDDQRARFEEQAATRARRATTRPTGSTRTTSGPSSTACRRPGGSGIGVDRLVMLLRGRLEHPRGHRLPDASARTVARSAVRLTRWRSGASRRFFGASYAGGTFFTSSLQVPHISASECGYRREAADAPEGRTQSKEDTMLRRIIAGTAVAGACRRSAWPGVAGAATPSTADRARAPRRQKRWMRPGGAKIEARVQKVEAKVTARIPKKAERPASELPARRVTPSWPTGSPPASRRAQKTARTEKRPTPASARIRGPSAGCLRPG